MDVAEHKLPWGVALAMLLAVSALVFIFGEWEFLEHGGSLPPAPTGDDDGSDPQ
eukprot:COSAG05_NODE_8067_length_739_cov_1.493750_1_plen_53_part_10